MGASDNTLCGGLPSKDQGDQFQEACLYYQGNYSPSKAPFQVRSLSWRFFGSA